MHRSLSACGLIWIRSFDSCLICIPVIVAISIGIHSKMRCACRHLEHTFKVISTAVCIWWIIWCINVTQSTCASWIVASWKHTRLYISGRPSCHYDSSCARQILPLSGKSGQSQRCQGLTMMGCRRSLRMSCRSLKTKVAVIRLGGAKNLFVVLQTFTKAVIIVSLHSKASSAKLVHKLLLSRHMLKRCRLCISGVCRYLPSQAAAITHIWLSKIKMSNKLLWYSYQWDHSHYSSY